MHLGNTTTNRYENVDVFLLGLMNSWILIIVFFLLFFVYLKCRIEYAHWALKRLLQNSLGDLCSVWDAMNNMMTLQHTEIKACSETITHVVGHVFKVTLYKRLLGIISRYALNQIAAEYECVHYIDKNPSRCGCVMKTTYALPCACELSKYVLGTIPLDSIHMF